MARPRGTGKRPEEKFITRSIRFPPELWARIEARSRGERGRSEFIREAVEKQLAETPAEVTRSGERQERVRTARGALAGVPGSVDAFLHRKQEEIDLEEERHRGRWSEPRP